MEHRSRCCAGTLFVLLWATAAVAQTSPASPPPPPRIVTIAEPVLAGGMPLPPGRYEIQFAGKGPSANLTQRDVEFVRDGVVVARETAEIVPAGSLAGSARVRVERLKEGDFVRVSFVDGDSRYLVYLPTTQ